MLAFQTVKFTLWSVTAFLSSFVHMSCGQCHVLWTMSTLTFTKFVRWPREKSPLSCVCLGGLHFQSRCVVCDVKRLIISFTVPFLLSCHILLPSFFRQYLEAGQSDCHKLLDWLDLSRERSLSRYEVILKWPCAHEERFPELLSLLPRVYMTCDMQVDFTEWLSMVT